MLRPGSRLGRGVVLPITWRRGSAVKKRHSVSSTAAAQLQGATWRAGAAQAVPAAAGAGGGGGGGAVAAGGAPGAHDEAGRPRGHLEADAGPGRVRLAGPPPPRGRSGAPDQVAPRPSRPPGAAIRAPCLRRGRLLLPDCVTACCLRHGTLTGRPSSAAATWSPRNQWHSVHASMERGSDRQQSDKVWNGTTRLWGSS